MKKTEYIRAKIKGKDIAGVTKAVKKIMKIESESFVAINGMLIIEALEARKAKSK